MSQSSQKLKRIVFAAGGTGGHIYPALAVADELKQMNKEIEICFIGAKGKMEERLVPGYGYRLETINIRGLSRKINPKNLITAFKLFSSVRESRAILKNFVPDVVFGTGGYVSGPVVWAARGLKIPTMLYEGNYYPGITVRLLASKVNKILLNFPESKRFFKDEKKIEVIPYPVRRTLKVYKRHEAAHHFGLARDRKTLFVFGGSQGAHSINNALLKNLNQLIDAKIQVIWQTGNKDYEMIGDKVKQNPDVRLFKFIDNIDYAYSAADLVVCRSGISALMELAYFGSAAIFVPYPFSSDNHQLKNAERLLEQKACGIIFDKELDSLASKIIELINDDSKLNEMRMNIKKFSDANAASRIAEFLIGFANKRN